MVGRFAIAARLPWKKYKGGLYEFYGEFGEICFYPLCLKAFRLPVRLNLLGILHKKPGNALG